MATPIAVATVEEEVGLVSWGAVIAGGIAAAAVSLVLLAFGIGVGFSVVSPLLPYRLLFCRGLPFRHGCARRPQTPVGVQLFKASRVRSFQKNRKHSEKKLQNDCASRLSRPIPVQRTPAESPF